MKKLPVIILCVLLLASVSFAVTPSDFDSWAFHSMGQGSPNNIGLSWGMEAGNYVVFVRFKDNNHVFFWTRIGEDDPCYMILDVFLNGKWISPVVYERQDDGSTYLKIWPK